MKTLKRRNWKTVVALAVALWMGPGPVAGRAAESAELKASATAPTRSEAKAKAIEQAVVVGYRQVAQSLGVTPDAAVEREVVGDASRWVDSSRILGTAEKPGECQVQVAVALDEPALRGFVAQRQPAGSGSGRPVAKELGDRLGRPNLVIALAPRVLGEADTAELAEQRTILFEQVNQALGQAFLRAGFRVVEPDWKSAELEQFRASTTGREAMGNGVAGDGAITLRRNVRYRAQMDMNVDYALLGTLTVSARNTGDQVTLALSVAGDILTTFTESDQTVPLQHGGESVAATLRSALMLSPAYLGDGLANSTAIPQLLQHWRDRVAEGTEYRLYVFHDDESLADGVLAFLKSNGEILAVDDRDTNLMALRYMTKAFKRADLSNDRLLRLALRQANGALPSDCQIRSMQGEIYFAPRSKRYDAVLAGIGQGARYLLKDYQARAFRAGDGAPPSVQPQPPVQPALQPQPQVQSQPQPTVVRAAEEPTEIRLQRAVAGIAKAVGLVEVGTGENMVSSGTAWAVRDRVWASNAHMTEPAAKALKAGRQVWIYPNLSSNKRIRVTRAIWYAQHWADRTDVDVGLLFTDEATADTVPIAPASRLLELSQGEPVALLGFPRGDLPQGNVNIENPIATMQTGIVSAMSDRNLANVSAAERTFIRHNLSTVGGASGSPLINRYGEVVGIHYGGPTVELKVPGADDSLRIKEASGVNYALRADLVRNLLEKASGG